MTFPVAPSVDTLNADSLAFVGTPNFLSSDGAAVTTGWQTAANVGAVNVNGPHYTFTINPSLATDFSQATITFGTLSQGNGNMAVYANNALIDNDFLPFFSPKDVSISLASLGTVNGPVQFKIIGWGTTNPGFLGLNGTFGRSNLIIDIPAQAPIPEPHEYAMLAGLGLVGFAVYRRRRMALQA